MTDAFITRVEPILKQVLISYGIITPQVQFVLTTSNISQFISEVEKLINNVAGDVTNICKQELKDDVTKYTKPAPIIEDTK